MLKKRMHAIWNASLYHGWGRKKRFFEGWYYKIVSADQKHAFAFIPGIAMDKDKNKQAFIQVLDGRKKTAAYHKFKANDFFPRPIMHDVLIGTSRFTMRKIELDLPDVQGTVEFEDQVPWPSSWYSPGIMGPFSFMPRMECYHGILSMDHGIKGTLTFNGEAINFDGGRGYMEKDWGHSFPSAYIWMQSNHFSEEGISIKTSVAKIPWMGTSFVGFIAGVWLKDKLIQFTTYNFSKLKACGVSDSEIFINLQSPKYLLAIKASRAESTILASPIGGFMDGRIEESMSATLHVTITSKKTGAIIFEDTGKSAGLEVAGNYEELLK